MSELIVKTNNHTSMRWKLLTGVSALALTAYTSSIPLAHAEDADRPTVWIQLGGAYSQFQNGQETFSPPLMAGRPSIFEPSQDFEHPPGASFDGQGSILIQPSESHWLFTASVRYGRSKSVKHNAQQTSPIPTTKYFPAFQYRKTINPVAERFSNTDTRNSEDHLILDFSAGKDVGLGLFGQHGSSLISLGVRFAQFRSGSNFSLKSDPDWYFQHKYYNRYGYQVPGIKQPFHTNAADFSAERSFHGIGPSVSWESNVPLVGDGSRGEIVADWGIDAALLFGRQKTRVHHQSTARYAWVSWFRQSAVPQTTARFPSTPDRSRSRAIIVPNIGGFAGLSVRYPNAKVSVGYRADFFFGAMDGGIDARKTYNQGFYGPYASISIGIGG